MRRLLKVVLAVPVILTAYATPVLRRISLRRHGAQQALLVLALPVLLMGFSAVRMELDPRPVAAGVAGVSATPFPDAAFAAVAIASNALDASSATPPARAVEIDPVAPARTPQPNPDDAPEPWLLSQPAGRVIVGPRATRTPSVVRFRPVAGSSSVAPDAEVSVRFSEAMDEAVTALTFGLTVNGTRATGAVRWAEGSTVLVLRPLKRFAAGATVVLAVSERAKSAAGIRLAIAASATFTVAKPAPKRTATPDTGSSAKKTATIPRSVAPGLYGVELYALELMNCTRTGGLVLRDGSCRGGGTRGVAPLKLDAGISDRVARPYAQLLASRRLCHHFYDGTPGSRLKRAGYTNWDWAENVGGCGSNAPYPSVLGTHLYFQSEKSYNGGHYRNLMNRTYDRVGIGIVKVNGVFRMVVNFYHP